MRATDTAIRTVNGLTARWASAVREGTVFSAAGIWPLLALLADGATEEVREELAEALGLPSDRAGAEGRELLALLAGIDGLESALGLWTARTVELREEWATALPVEAHGVLTGDPQRDKRALDAWAARRTGGAIERIPADLRPDTSLVLTTALVLRTEWEVPFKGDLMPWRGHDRAGLTRTHAGLDAVAVARTPCGAVTVATVRGTNGIDVLLLLGDEELAPQEVIDAGVGVVSGTLPAVPGERLPYGQAGPGLRLERVSTLRPEPPSLTLRTVEFTLTAGHDLLAQAELFGLATAADGSPGHFPGISAAPLALASGRQSATATFSAEGFRAAAVTLMEAVWLGWEDRPEPQYETTRAHAVFDRPFGFLAVDRATDLVLAAGWVTDPKLFPEDEDAYVLDTSGGADE
ncbi:MULTISPECIES: serpin family protein [Streptomyces]|uniref:Proteinase inhibitor I4 serpin n=1 Tax=Streptomyces koelreuteriae TaxID=2838015 RepID=A0ABX8G389_9ACTN|nr:MULTISPECIES: serpin family protein [Streptomyces]QWB27600.1 proteinase inhibitor I4 serpin [Streptomyces koelreuteriae]UUA10693.1 serpin family protein [Streptomyces koelreuteriae]UUA18300.1 serpin family protein [Streptomyces sp. CRCS-T-1]